MKQQRLVILAGLFFILSFSSGCATYQSKIGESRRLLEQGRPADALEKMKPLAETANGDQLAYLLEYATALQLAGQTKESNDAFLRADKLAEDLDYHSISRISGSLLTNEEAKQYKGDTFEKIFINAQLALNFLQQGNFENAMVQARRINEKYLKLRGEDKENFELNSFAKYLSALIWEADRSYDNASISFNDVYKIDPQIHGIEEDLIRTAKLARRDDEYKRWKKQFPEVKESPEWYDRKRGELIVIIQQGWGPRKTAARGDSTWPVLSSYRVNGQAASVEIAGLGTWKSREIYDVEDAQIKTLEEDRASLVGRRVGAFVAKEVVADQIRQKDELLGFFAWIFMHASERADLRQWSTLPQTIQLIRIRLKPGTYPVVLRGLDNGGMPTGETREESAITIKADQKTFLLWRTLR